MKRTVAALGFMLWAVSSAYAAEDFATAKDAEAIVARAVQAIAENKDATFKEITAKNAKWIQKDLYPVV